MTADRSTRRRRWLAGLAGCVLGAGLLAPVAAQTPDEDDRVTDEVLLELVPAASIDEVAARYGLTVIEGVPRWYLWRTRVSPGDDVDSVVHALKNDDEVADAEPHRRFETPEGVQETIADLDVGGNSLTFRNQTAAKTIKTLLAQTRYTGAGVRVAVLDTGTSLSHPEIAANILDAGADFAGGNGTAGLQDNHKDDDGDGLVDESSNHATHAIGLIVLVAPDAEIVPVRVLEEDGKGTAFAVANAVLYALGRRADVINLSFSLPFPSRIVERALEDAEDRGVVVVAAAGNRGRQAVEFPASLPQTIAVAGVDAQNVRSAFSNYGPEIDISAPAENLLSPHGNKKWARWGGTSFATPMVSGAVALLLEKYPGLTTAEVRDVLQRTAAPDSNPPSLSGLMGAGVLDLDALTLESTLDRTSLEATGAEGGTVFSWSPVRDATLYDLARGNLSEIVAAYEQVDLGHLVCIADDLTVTDSSAFPDPQIPAPGEAFFYLFRDNGVDAAAGTFGTDGDGHPRVADPVECTTP